MIEQVPNQLELFVVIMYFVVPTVAELFSADSLELYIAQYKYLLCTLGLSRIISCTEDNIMYYTIPKNGIASSSTVCS